MPDKYDDAIELLTENPERIFETWSNPAYYPEGCLFTWAHRKGLLATEIISAGYCGCLTQVRSGGY